jgi:hypothetical protein
MMDETFNTVLLLMAICTMLVLGQVTVFLGWCFVRSGWCFGRSTATRKTKKADNDDDRSYKGQDVYNIELLVTANGKRYHAPDCQYVQSPVTSRTLTACKTCKPLSRKT